MPSAVYITFSARSGYLVLLLTIASASQHGHGSRLKKSETRNSHLSHRRLRDKAQLQEAYSYGQLVTRVLFIDFEPREALHALCSTCCTATLLQSMRCALQQRLERSLWNAAFGTQRLERSAWSTESGAHRLESSAWSATPGAQRLERSAWSAAHGAQRIERNA